MILPLLILGRAWGEDDPLIENTKAAEERVEQWNVESKKIEKKESWEIPVVSALGFIGVIFYAGGRTPGYAACGVAAVGLSIRFWPFGPHHGAPENPSN